MEMLKVMVVDDNETFLRAALLMLSSLTNVTVVGTANTGASAVLTVQQRQPDLILMDVNMPGMNGLATAARMREAGVTAKIVFVSMDSSTEAQARALGLDFYGFIPKADFYAGLKRLLDELIAWRNLCGAAR